MSHWTDVKGATGRMITLHLKGKTLGNHQFTVTLAGPGVKPVHAGAVPRLLLREAGKQQGLLLLVPEQGMRLQAVTREGVTQLDPMKSGVTQKGVLAFRLFTFHRPLEVNQRADLKIRIEASAMRPAPVGLRFLLLVALFIGALVFVRLLRQSGGKSKETNS